MSWVAQNFHLIRPIKQNTTETCRNQREQQFIQNNRVQRITGVLPEVSTTAFFPKIFATFGSGGSASLAAEIQCGCRQGSKQLLASVLKSCIETIFVVGRWKHWGWTSPFSLLLSEAVLSGGSEQPSCPRNESPRKASTEKTGVRKEEWG